MPKICPKEKQARGAFFKVSLDVFIGRKRNLPANRKQGEPLGLLSTVSLQVQGISCTFLSINRFLHISCYIFDRMKIERATEKMLKPSAALFLFSLSKHATFSKI
jgi:hypothetical protein